MDRLPVADSGEDAYTTLSLYEMSLRQANIAFWAWNEDVEEAYLISDLLYEILEIPKSKYLADLELQDPVYQVIHPDDLEEYKHIDRDPPYEKYAQGDSDCYRIDYRIVTSSGRIKYLREYGRVLRDDNGHITWSYGTVQDISDLKETEQELTIAQRISSVGSWIWSVSDGRLVSCTEEYARIHGVSMDNIKEHMELQMERVIHPDDRDRMRDEFLQADQNRGEFESTYRIIRPDGEIRLIRELGEYIPDKNDESKVLQRGVIQDITDRSKAEQIISRQSDLLNLLYEVTRAANETNTLENALKTCLEKVCIFQHWPVGHFYWRSDEHDNQFVSSEIWYCNDWSQYQPFIEETDRLKVPSSGGLVEQVVANEESQWIADFNALDGFAARGNALDCGLKCGYAVPVYCDGQIVAVTEFFTDQRIKPDKQLIETLDHMASQLSQVFIRRRHEQSLEGALQAAKQSSQAKSDFLSSMSHELRTPLNAIIGFAQLIQVRGTVKEMSGLSNAIEHILGAGQHLLDLVNQVLELEKIESGGISITRSPVTIAAVLDECLSMAAVLSDKAEIEIRNEVEQQSMTIETDRMRLVQILLNLLSNAIKYNDRAGYVVIKDEFPMEDCYRISVVDTGPGIPADKRDAVFVPFDRLGRETGKTEGSGIGLTIARQLAGMLGGEIGFTSEVGVGSTFWVDLPLTGQGSDRHPKSAESTSQNEPK